MSERIRSDNGPEFAVAVKEWLGKLEAKTFSMEPGNSWENEYIESCDRKFRDEFLTREG